MRGISIQTTKPVRPQIYCYTTPEIRRHDGWSKIGYTEQDVVKRVKQQAHTADVECILHWHDNALYAGSNEVFTDKAFH